jgi:hypothetical protein
MDQTRHERTMATRPPTLAEMTKKYDLTPDEVDRMQQLTKGDPLSDYAGFPEVQAQYIVEERQPDAIVHELGHSAVHHLQRSDSAA